MNDTEKIEQLADILDAEAGSITPETPLDTLNWDSMGMLSVIALARTNGKVITGAQARAFTSVQDLLNAAF